MIAAVIGKNFGDEGKGLATAAHRRDILSGLKEDGLFFISSHPARSEARKLILLQLIIRIFTSCVNSSETSAAIPGYTAAQIRR